MLSKGVLNSSASFPDIVGRDNVQRGLRHCHGFQGRSGRTMGRTDPLGNVTVMLR
jgi:hypothetical protein